MRHRGAVQACMHARGHQAMHTCTRTPWFTASSHGCTTRACGPRRLEPHAASRTAPVPHALPCHQHHSRLVIFIKARPAQHKEHAGAVMGAGVGAGGVKKPRTTIIGRMAQHADIALHLLTAPPRPAKQQPPGPLQRPVPAQGTLCDACTHGCCIEVTAGSLAVSVRHCAVGDG